ncbi:MAG: hypothetical protein Hyperionvirus21_27 [Hyperionvirus sp.]|uniref:Glutamine amidotransferase type-2 domain-containing protein n=1 Tax=Hyperionvirus sp. TaxID=2487770 RepID=A0A3G5AEI9_9VIRU|nr:MAG: hypothetical protein Hyperionvirus21_27 [Hyperionvirus sp.]
MCSFLVTNSDIINLIYINYFLKFRGPDQTNKFLLNGYNFVHNLLHITGEVTLQPFVDDEVVCLYNGEIYNYKSFGDYKSDGLCLLDLYKKYGTNFIKHLDGEFAIVLFDFKKRIIIATSDVFATKPIWYSIQNGKICIASYESALARLDYIKRIKIPANTTYIFNLSDHELMETKSVYDFDLTQYKDHFNDWVIAFDKSIKKRAFNMIYPLFICLSSGYDSGCIAASLNKQKIPYTTYTILADETIDIIEQRLKINNKNHVPAEIIEMTQDQFDLEKNLLQKNCEEFIYKKTPSDESNMKMTDDQAATGLSYICSRARTKGIRIFLSGQGADEIYSDYGFNGKKFFDHSCFGGLFPNYLSDIIPDWYSFYNGTMSSYIGKEEHVAGSHGIEGRYPFLDKQLVQEFFWLKPELKNVLYKAPLHVYLKMTYYPFEVGKKIGFSAAKNLKQVKKNIETYADINKDQAYHEEGYCYVVNIPQYEHLSDNSEFRQRSTLKLFENDIELTQSHTLHKTIRDAGAGRYSHWKGQLYFSSSDKTNPLINGKTYHIKITHTITNNGKYLTPINNYMQFKKLYSNNESYFSDQDNGFGYRQIPDLTDDYYLNHSMVILTSYFSKKIDTHKNVKQNRDDFNYISPWYLSMKQLNLHGIIFYDDLSPEFIEKYQTKKIIFKKCVYGDYSLNDERFIIYYMYLLKNPYKKIFMTDICDVTIKKNPGPLINSLDKLYVGSDLVTTLIDSGWCQIKTDSLFSQLSRFYQNINDIKPSFLAGPCHNAGVIGGDHKIISFLLKNMISIFYLINNDQNNNMMVLNFVIYMTMLYDRSTHIMCGYPLTSKFGKFDTNSDAYIVHK